MINFLIKNRWIFLVICMAIFILTADKSMSMQEWLIHTSGIAISLSAIFILGYIKKRQG